MDHKQLRVVLREHFDRFLDQRKAKIDADGPLSSSEQELLRNTAAVAELQLKDGPIDAIESEAETAAFSKLYGLGIEPRTAKFEALQRAFVQAQRDWANATLSYSAKAETFDFVEKEPPSEPTPKPTSGLTLQQLVAEYQKVVEREGGWSPKTEQERSEHFRLLYERFGEDSPVIAIGREQANAMRKLLMVYPKNRNKSERTRRMTLDELIQNPEPNKLHNLTINKYLNAYNSLFNWAYRTGYCKENPFEKLSLKADKTNKEAPRVKFEPYHIDLIVRTLLDNTSGRADHHKWGTLLAVHSGARLNEIAQLHLDDIREIDGVWCIDINEKVGTNKKLKNDSSARIVPIHPKLLSYGFLSYVDSIKQKRGEVRLFPKLTYSASEGYGRNLGRWVNEKLLPSLDIKTKQLTFHSFRHTVIGELFNAEVPEHHVMAIAGHRKETVTLKVYNRGGFKPSILLKAIETLFAGEAWTQRAERKPTEIDTAPD